MVHKQLQKQILEENHSGIIHVAIYQYNKFYDDYIAVIDIMIILHITTDVIIDIQ